MSVKRRDVSEEDGTSAAGIPIFGPVPPDPQRTIESLLTRLQQVESERDKAEADAAMVREALERSRGFVQTANYGPSKWLDDALATNAGKSLLEWKREAERLLRDAANDHRHRVTPEWLNLRDAFLNPTTTDQRKVDVK